MIGFMRPIAAVSRSVTLISGDTWNVNPIALKRVEQLFCKNERAVILTRMAGYKVALVPVAAILVAGIRLQFLDQALRDHDGVRRTFPCNASIGKGEEMGWFEHGSTIIVFALTGFQALRRCSGGFGDPGRGEN